MINFAKCLLLIKTDNYSYNYLEYSFEKRRSLRSTLMKSFN